MLHQVSYLLSTQESAEESAPMLDTVLKNTIIKLLYRNFVDAALEKTGWRISE